MTARERARPRKQRSPPDTNNRKFIRVWTNEGRGRITVNMLDLYISERVKTLTAGMQTPTTAKPQTVPDFPIALKR